MMKYRVILLALLFGLISACTTTQETEETAATVEDRDTTEQAETYPSDDEMTTELNPLEDPNSPLSVRVIYFEYDSSEVQSQFQATIEAHANYLAANPDVVVSLEGHADERGSREYNLALGERRALAVSRQLALLGASTSQIRTISYGEERPVVDGHDESSWSQNRRVEISY